MQARVQGVYRSVIDELIGGVKHDFLEAGIDEAILDELRVSWEAKLSQSGALEATAYSKAVETDKQQLLAADSQQAQTLSKEHISRARPASAAAAAIPPSASAAPAAPACAVPSAWPSYPTSFPGQLPPGLQPYRASAGPGAYPVYGQASQQGHHLPAPLQQPMYHPKSGAQLGLQAHNMLPPQQVLQQQQHPQHSYFGAVPSTSQQLRPVHPPPYIPQQDGAGDEPPGAKKGQSKAKKAKTEPETEPAPAASDSESPAPSEPGDRLSDVELGDEEDVFSPTAPEVEAPHKVLCLFESVKRIRTRWKCQFKDVVMNIHGQDLLFTTAAADFTFQ